ncbi:MAG TPA: hypothetical protein VMG31_02090 [Verrucomicrobiae bacterium]|nr:hypothetical protein [Verrucomicrobiae bacterium]
MAAIATLSSALGKTAAGEVAWFAALTSGSWVSIVPFIPASWSHRRPHQSVRRGGRSLVVLHLLLSGTIFLL